MKTRQGDSLFLKVDVGGETVRVFGHPEELAELLEATGPGLVLANPASLVVTTFQRVRSKLGWNSIFPVW
ncbi:MAG TPA: hypothetical protein VLV88_07245 [Terriglobales bacterium]|nr:hypothetical protein [Terriglobales bacterium]